VRAFIASVVLVLAACGQDVGEPIDDNDDDDQSVCGRYATQAPEGYCECRRGYEWCYPEIEDDTNCCAIDAFCGNDICDAGESNTTCPDDCEAGVRCGDGTCSPSEASTTCPADCGEPSVCGNGDCELDENPSSCPGDCDTSTGRECGNGVCESGESAQTCPADCRQSEGRECGNGVCEFGETRQTCAADCGTDESPVCGNGICESTESSATCPSDCAASECTTAACVEERCIDGCDTFASCGVAGDDLADCYDNCLGWDAYYDDWLDPRVKRSDCYAALGALFGCEAALSCEELGTENACVREIAGYERECPEIPFSADVTFLSVLMGPHSTDGCQWDGPTCSPLSDEQLGQITSLIIRVSSLAFGATGVFAAALFQDAASDVSAIMLGGLMASTAPPDIFGTITVQDSLSGARVASVPVTNNSYQPSLGRVTFESVEMDNRVLVELELYDEDLSENDPVGPVFLDRNQLLTAWMSGGNAWVLVAERAQDTVLQVQLRVIEAE
jgi:hypothetical protein